MGKIYLLFLLLIPFGLFSQDFEDKKQEIIEERIDFLLDNNESGDMDYTNLFELLDVFYERPINLNSTTKEELIDLQLLSEIQINNLLQHIDKNGKLISFEELQSIDGFDLSTIRNIQPFTKVGRDLDQPLFSFNTILKEGKSQWFLRYSRILEEQQGFSDIDSKELEENPNARYLGSADKLFTRYRFNYSNVMSVGFTAEKDAGEEFFRGSNPNGFDFYSAHFYVENLGAVKQLALGDFQAQFGQGLTFSSGLAFGISPSVQTIKRNSRGLRPYTSVQEDLFLRGGGIALERDNWELTLFYSNHKVDANITGYDSLNNEFEISSLPIHGFHRTPNELEDKNLVLNENTGANLSYSKRNFSIGATAVYNRIGANYQPREALYNKFSKLKQYNSNVGIDYSYIFKNINLFGEFSKTIDGGMAYTNGALLIIDPRLSIGILNRKYDFDFRPIQSTAIGENTYNTNEKGTFLGINATPIRYFTFSAYVDRFSFPWLRYQTDAPSQGHRQLLQLNYKPNKQLEVYLRYRQRAKGKNNNLSVEEITEVVQEINTNYRFHISYQVSSSVQLKSRVEYMEYQLGNNTKENGLLIYQDLQYKRLSFPLSFSIRFALFDTESYNSRIYAYENDVLYAFSIPAYYGRGSRFYLVTKYHIGRNIDLWLRYAQTYYTDRDEIGSGKDVIYGNTKSEVKAQLRIKF